MTSLESGWRAGGTIPLFHENANTLGHVPFTSSGISGPVFDTTGKQLRPMNPAEGFAEFFGNPKKKLERPASEDLEQELYDLPAAYSGKNSYLSQILISHITEDETWILREFAPWTKFEQAMTVNWDVWTFMDHQLGRTPEEAVSRLLSSKVTAEQTTMVRYGIALMLEHGFFNTPKGRKHYAMNIKQIQNAIVETAAFGAMFHAVNAEIWVDGYDIYRDAGRSRTKNGLDAFFATELDTWAMLQKSDDGFVNMISQMEEALSMRNGVVPDIVCLPKGTSKYYQNITMGKPYAESGLKIGERKDLISSGLAGTGLRYRESRYFRQNEHRAAIDPAYQDRTIGTFFQVNSNCLKNVDPKDYKTSMLDTIIYNEDSDGMEMFSYRENFRYFGLFKDFDNTEFAPQSHLGKKYFAGINNWWDYLQTHSRYDKDYIVKGIASKTPDVQAKFVHAMLGSGDIRGTTDFSGYAQYPDDAARPGQVHANARFHGSGRAGTSSSSRNDERKYVSSDVLSAQKIIEQLQHEFKLNAQDARQIARFIGHLEELEIRSRGGCEFLSKVQSIVKSRRSTLNASNLYTVLELELASELLKYDLNRAAIDVRSGVVDVQCTALENTFQSYWPDATTTAMQAAERNSPYWQMMASKKSRLPVNVYHSPDHTKPLPLHSQVFTLTSSSLALLKLSPVVLQDLKQNAGVISVDYTPVPANESLHDGELTRAGLLQFSVALSAVYEILKATQPVYEKTKDVTARRALLAEALKNVQSVVASVHPVSGDENDYLAQVELAEALPILECQQSLASLLVNVRTIVCGIIRNQLDAETFAQSAFTFWNQYKVLYSNDNPSRNDQGSTGAMVRPLSATTNLASIVLSTTGQRLDAFYGEALEKTEALRGKLVNEESKTDTETDSFIAFSDSYVELYQCVRAKGWNAEFWTQAVTHMHNVYKKQQGSLDATDAVAALLELCFAALNDNTTTETPHLKNVLSKEELTKQVADRASRLEKLRKEFQTRIEHHQKYNVNQYKDVRAINTASREARKRLLEVGVGTLDRAPKTFDTVVAWLLDHSPRDLENAIRIAAAHLGGNTDQSANILLEYLCLEHDSVVEAEQALAGLDNEIARRVRVSVLKNGNIVEHWKQIRLKWGQDDSGTSASNVAAAEKKSGEDPPILTERQIVELLKTPVINGGFIHFCIDNDVLPPLGGIGYKPHMTYEVGTAWMAQGGGKCASTLFGHADFQLGDDPARKIHYGHFTMYNKTVIWSRQHIVHARNVFVRDYKGGNGTSVWDPLDPNDVDSYLTNDLKFDIFWIPTPIGHFINSKHQSITGCYPKELQPTKEANEATRFHGLEIFAKHWHWEHQDKRDPLTPTVYQDAKHNIICFQAHQGVYNHTTKFQDRIITEKGHWGPNVYATCGKTRRGGLTHKTLLHVNHNGTNTIQLVKN